MIKSKLMVAALFCIGPMTTALAQDLDAGANSFKKCAPCHVAALTPRFGRTSVSGN